MSYILDALRRAESQRQQQHPVPPGLGEAMTTPPVIPGPSAPPATAEPATTSSGRRSPIVWMAVGAAALTGLLAVLLPPRATAPAAPEATATPPATRPASTATVMAPPSPPASSPAAPPAPMLQPAPASAPVAAPASAPDSARAPAAAASPSAPSPASVPRYADLPEAVRAGLPAISVQGVTWSENPAWRNLIVNGRVLQEGQSIGPGHVLEQIGRDGSVLNYRGQRYRIGH